jgi:hypothetical protein
MKKKKMQTQEQAIAESKYDDEECDLNRKQCTGRHMGNMSPVVFAN